ncbi:SRPBCC family protein [Segetibacter aerophilus]|uniref:Cyclase n=1 Tax=Segetibacter aerophilus TaxID=670293 RepID=A0A512BB51_9BACT|nr:SRPBCC family protein [Segetibacter aerophilus]GEO09191.1 cyclase [Segetibacter aerophilus]
MNTNSETGAKLSVNVGKIERIASIIGGSLLIYQSITSDKKKLQLPAALGGLYLLARGATGHDSFYSLAGKRKLPDTVKNINIITKVTVNRPRMEVYNFWRKLSNLPLFMQHLEQVEVLDDKRSHWKAKVPGHLGTIEWDAEIVKEIEGELLGWNSLPGATIHNAGKVEFRDINGYGTELHVVITYRAPFGDVGEGLASLLNPVVKKMIIKDVKGFKRYIEAGDIATIE